MTTLSSANEEKIQTAINLLNQIVPTGISALDKLSKESSNLEVFTFILYLERATYSLESINILLANYMSKPNVETTIGLALRAGLLDFMTVLYILTYKADLEIEPSEVTQNEFDRQFKSILVDQVLNTITSLKLLKCNGQLNTDDYNTLITNLFSDYYYLFTTSTVDFVNPEEKLITKQHIAPSKLFKRISNHSIAKQYAQVYDLYLYYSKYEHAGIMTYTFQRHGRDQEIINMIASLKYLIANMAVIITLFDFNFSSGELSTEIEILKKQRDMFALL